jgi:outer membrane lipoprotein-sorting protein
MNVLQRPLKGSPKIRALLVIALGLLLVAWASSWDALQSHLGDIHSLKADFIQKKHLPALSRPLVSKGTVFYQAPGSLRWEYTSPMKSVTLLNQGRAVRYTFSNNQTHQEDGNALAVMQTVLSKMRDWLQGEFTDSSHFAATLSSNGTITLTPRKEGLAEFISHISLSLGQEPGIIRSVTIVESPDSSTQITFSNVHINCKLQPSIFEKPK